MDLVQNFVQNPIRASYYAFLSALDKMKGTNGVPVDFNPETSIVQPLILRVHQLFASGKSKYTFDLKSGNTPGLDIEKKMQPSDVFMMTALALGIQKYNPAGPDYNQPVFTEADPGYFGAAEAAALEKLYGGKIGLKSGSNTRISDLDTSIFKFAPAKAFAGTFAAPTGHSQYGSSHAERGYVDLGAYPILLGQESNTVDVELASGNTADIAGTAPNNNNLVLFVLGWVYRGSSNNGSCIAF